MSECRKSGTCRGDELECHGSGGFAQMAAIRKSTAIGTMATMMTMMDDAVKECSRSDGGGGGGDRDDGG